ncbi:1-acyl-sn-glycerol-3-phosphate acyltransferase [Leptolyngbya sp. AN02str]|uniref:1-acyl-sn-glycerol-3-phosphate acyltransferase n=1 Tax=Leptolyngbya sp. AN02str TaxID=3423363 RepID=UPI003D31401E
MPRSTPKVQPPLEFIPPDFNPLMWRITRLLLPYRMRWGSQVAGVEVEQGDRLVQLYQQFQEGKVRFLMAFRHPSAADPECMFWLLAYETWRRSRQLGIPLQGPIHSHFIYDRGIPLWAGQYLGWLYSKLGGVPIKRGRVDTQSLRTIRNLMANAPMPMAAAPEGATNGHNELVSPIEPGIAQFGFWCWEDLQKAGRDETVLIVPIGLQYRFVTSPWSTLELLLSNLERESGMATSSDPTPPLMLQDGVDPTAEQQFLLYQRLLRLGERLLSLMEQFYTKFYHRALIPLSSVAKASEAESSAAASPNDVLATRLQTLLNTALTVAEESFGLVPKGNLTDRCRRLEQAAWDCIFREDIKQPETLPPVELGLANRIAEEADLRIWHMRVVETFVSVTGYYVKEKPTAERFAETLLLVWDVVTRLKGEVPFPYPKLGMRRAYITIGEPISIDDRAPEYKANRKQAVTTLTQDLQTALEAMIHR